MSQKEWQISKVCYCEKAGHEVVLENEVVYPAEHLPDQPPHIIAHRCSNAVECNQLEKMTCAYCGTNAEYRPI